MMRILVVLFLSLCGSLCQLSAQVVLNIEAKDSVVVGEEFTVDILVDGFTNITSAQFELGWNELAFELLNARPIGDSSNSFRVNALGSSVRLLYFDQESQVTGLTLPSGSLLLQLDFRVLESGMTGLNCVSERSDMIQTEFIAEALIELDVSVNEYCVHLQGTSSLKSLEQTKLSYSWPEPEMITVYHPPAFEVARLSVFDIQGRLLASIKPLPASTKSSIFFDSPLNPTVVILRYTIPQQETTLLIVGPH